MKYNRAQECMTMRYKFQKKSLDFIVKKREKKEEEKVKELVNPTQKLSKSLC